MSNLDNINPEEIQDQEYILVKVEGSNEYAWQAPRGTSVIDESDKWTLNPKSAFTYKSLAAALNAQKRMYDKYPDDFKGVQVRSLKSYSEK